MKDFAVGFFWALIGLGALIVAGMYLGDGLKRSAENEAFKAIAALPTQSAQPAATVVEYCVGGFVYYEFPRGGVAVSVMHYYSTYYIPIRCEEQKK